MRTPLCSKAPSSNAAKGLIHHSDHLCRQHWHWQMSPWMSPSPHCGGCSAWLERPSTHGPATGNAITPWRAMSPHVPPQGTGLGPLKVTWRWHGGRAPSGGAWAQHMAAHTCAAHPHDPTYLCMHTGVHPLPMWLCACVHTCTEHTCTTNPTCKRTLLCLHTQLCIPMVHTRSHTHAGACMKAHAGECTGKPTVAHTGMGYEAQWDT